MRNDFALHYARAITKCSLNFPFPLTCTCFILLQIDLLTLNNFHWIPPFDNLNHSIDISIECHFFIPLFRVTTTESKSTIFEIKYTLHIYTCSHEMWSFLKIFFWSNRIKDKINMFDLCYSLSICIEEMSFIGI